MFLELAEALDCPRCRDGYGLVTFVDRADRRRVLDGRLGCPMCEVEFPIVEGSVRFGAAAAAASGFDPGSDPAAAVRIAALLGLQEGAGRVVLLGPGPGPLGADVAALAARVEILAWLEDGSAPPAWSVEELSRGVNPVLGADPARWPVRAGALDGVALASPAPGAVDEAVRALRPEGRLVLLDPDDETLEGLSARSVEELASDASAWVGRRR